MFESDSEKEGSGNGAVGQGADGGEKACAYRVLRYTPNLVRDEWVNIGVLVFNPETGERKMRLIEEHAEFARVRKLHPQADEALLRKLREDLEDRFRAADASDLTGGWQQILAKWDNTLSNALQLAPQKGVLTHDLEAETERLYRDHVALERGAHRIGAPGTRADLRERCSQVFHLAGLSGHIVKSVRVEEFTFPGDPMRIDYGYRRNGTQGYVHCLSVTHAPGDAKLLSYTADHIQGKSRLKTEFTAVTDVALDAKVERHRFVRDTLLEVGIEPIPVEGFAVWVDKLKPTLMRQ